VISRPVRLGRERSNEVHLDDPRVSRAHAQVRASGGALHLSDLQSRHGTFLNGERVGDDEVKLEPGAIVRCGDTLLLVVTRPESYRVEPYVLSRTFLSTRRDALGGPTTWSVWQQATQMASLRQPVLILGESGAGKEAVARLIHRGSAPDRPFLALNVAAVAPELFESELFGHTRGAFTGAASTRLGAFREAGRGTLFLDEIAELRGDLQVKLLRALEEMRVRPVGANVDYPVEARVVTATNRNLTEAVANGTFRSELYFRIAGLVLHVPPLRERRDEILLIAVSTLKADHPDFTLSADAAEALALSRWEGNVRELQHALARAVVQATTRGTQVILAEHLPEPNENAAPKAGKLSPRAVRLALSRAEGNASGAAKLLGISRATLYNFCDRESISLGTLRAEIAKADGKPPPGKR
jgi:DNA-binding NtrC family response regulator